VLINRILFVRVTNERGTAVLSSVGRFRITHMGFVRLRLRDLVALSTARTRAGTFTVQCSTSPHFSHAVVMTARFKTHGHAHAQGHDRHHKKKH